MKKIVATAAALLVTAGGCLLSTTPAPAVAVTGTVPNHFECNSLKLCRQINGSYARSLPTACKWVPGLFTSNRSISLCDYWVVRF